MKAAIPHVMKSADKKELERQRQLDRALNPWERNGERESRPGSIEAHHRYSSLLTPRWRELDSNSWSPPISP
jgi:hypothetical protein